MRILSAMNPVQYIRKIVFHMTQSAFAATLGVTQPSIARWEATGRVPDEHQSKVREIGRDICNSRGISWNDAWFFEVPAETSEAA